jgi:hypothetical protein
MFATFDHVDNALITANFWLAVNSDPVHANPVPVVGPYAFVAVENKLLEFGKLNVSAILEPTLAPHLDPTNNESILFILVAGIAKLTAVTVLVVGVAID